MIYEESTITVIHYTGKVTYDCLEMPEKNRDFLSPEIIETLRSSKNAIISLMFTSKLDRTGNLIMAGEELRKTKYGFQSKVCYLILFNKCTDVFFLHNLKMDISSKASHPK